MFKKEHLALLGVIVAGFVIGGLVNHYVIAKFISPTTPITTATTPAA